MRRAMVYSWAGVFLMIGATWAGQNYGNAVPTTTETTVLAFERPVHWPEGFRATDDGGCWVLLTTPDLPAGWDWGWSEPDCNRNGR